MQMLEASVLINAGSPLNAGGSEARVDRSFTVCCLEIKTGVLSHKRDCCDLMSQRQLLQH